MSKHLLIEKKIEGQQIFKGKIIEVELDKVRLPNNSISTREVVKHGGAVGIIPINDNRELILVRQYRYPVGEALLEIPAGKLDQQEEPLACAARELREETGFIAEEMVKVCDFFTSPGFSNEVIHLYMAKGLKQAGQMLDEDEFLNIEQVSLREAINYIYDGRIKDGKTIVGILAINNLE
ncbi:MAG: NUDIX hydrolase [Bacillota bacterium]|nr:NUDIX hydrolase [Bacillota bacterium]